MEPEIKELIQLLTSKLNSVILVHWKQEDKFEVFKNLSVFTDTHQQFSYETIDYSIGRNNRPYKTDIITIYRLEVIRHPIQSTFEGSEFQKSAPKQAKKRGSLTAKKVK